MSKISKKKLLVYPLTLVTFAAGIASCGDSNPTSTPISDDPTSSTDSSSTPTSSVATPTVTGVTIAGGDTVSAQAPLTLTATVEGTVSDKSVTWTSSNTSVATVSSAGVVTVVGVVPTDTAVVITATSVADPTKSATKAVTVTASVVVVNATQSSITIKDREVEGYDFKQYFTITVDGDPVNVTDAMIDASDVEKTPDTYTVSCTYGGRTKAIAVTVSETIYEVSSSVDSVQLKVMEVENYDFESLFTITMDGVEQEITEGMISSTVTAAVGDYSYTVEYNGSSKTIDVKVVEDHIIEAIPAYTTYSILSAAVEYLDPTELFSLIVDGEPKKVEASMVNASALTSAVGEYTVTFSYTEDSTTATASVTVNVVANPSIAITGKNVTIYPGSDPVSVSSLFTAIIDGEEVEVPEDAIEGYIDYSKLGTNTLTLTIYDPFRDEQITATSTVTIKTGAHLDYAKSNTIVIQKGTDASKYAFANDAILISNGRSYGIDNRYVDASQVNFAVAGAYPVTITVPYTEVAGATEDITLTIHYVVLDKVSTVEVKESSITSNVALTDAEIINNLIVVIDGKNQTLYTDKNEVINSLTTYVVIDKSAVDVSVPGTYQISVEVYVEGPDSTTRVVVSFDVVVPSDVVISVKPGASTTVIEGTAVRPATLFNIVEGTTPVEVTNDMVSGKVDVFEPGVYGVTVSYKGVSQTVDIVVVSKDIFGSFSTNLVGSTKTDSDDYTDDVTSTTTYFRDKFVINEDLTGSIGSTIITDVQGVDAYTLTFKINSFTYKYTYDEGIAVLIPLNTTKMSYTDGMRYYMFAKDSIFRITGRMVINSGSSHIIGSSSTCTSIDILELTMVEGGGVLHYGLRSELLEVGPYSSYYYKHTLSQVSFSEGFRQATGESGTIYMDHDDAYSMDFTMTDNSTGKMDRADDDGYAKNYEGVYTGTVDGKEATLTINAYNGLNLVIDGVQVANPSGPDIKGLLNGGYDYENDIITIYRYNESTNNGNPVYEYYSYVIHLDTTANTFIVDEKDGYQGLYKAADGSTVFIDGYGSGIFQGATLSFSTRASFDYVIEEGMLKATFENLKPTYAYGSFAYFYVDNFTNELVLANSDVSSLVGNKYLALAVEKGVQVTVSNYTVNIMEDEQDAIDQLLSYFTIFNADGEVTGDAKEDMIDYSLVDFSEKGFYLVTVTAEIGGVDVIKYYTFETVAPLYDGNIVVGTYISSASSSRSVTIDRFGNLTYVRNSSATYTGKVTINDDYTFSCVATRTTSASETVTISGHLLVNGAISFTAIGFEENIVYGVAGSTMSGNRRTQMLRTYRVGDELFCIYGTSENNSTTYAPATVTSLNGMSADQVGAVVRVVCGETDMIIKITGTSNNWSGIQFAQDERGTYTLEGSDSLVLDGFGVSSSSMGSATIGDTTYNYYVVNSRIPAIALVAGTVTTYVDIDRTAKTYTLRTNEFADVAGTYGALSNNSISTSTSSANYFSINEYGVGTYYSSSASYTGTATIDAEGNMVFTGVYSTDRTITVNITKVIDHVYTTSGSISTTSSSGEVTDSAITGGTIALATATRISYVGVGYSNYIAHFKAGDDDIFVFSPTSSSPRIVNITSVNDVDYSTVGCIFSVAELDGTSIIAQAKLVSTSSTNLGYVVASAQAGTYTLADHDSLTLDGFANATAAADGVATLGSDTGVYTIVSGDVIKVVIDGVTTVVRLDTTSKTYAVIEEGTYTGQFLGEFGRLDTSANSNIVTIDSYGIITYGTSGGSSPYYAMMPDVVEDGTFSVVANAYGSTSSYELTLTYLADGILHVVVGSSSYFYVTGEYTAEVFAKVSNSATIIFSVVDGDNVTYLYAPTRTTATPAIATITATSDSAAEFGTAGSIFDLTAGDNVSFTAKITNSSGILALADMAQRKSYTGPDGSTLFTDGFTTSATARGNATIGAHTYTYYYNPLYANTIVLYAENGDIVDYCVITENSYVSAPVIIDTSITAVGTYASATGGTDVITFNEQGYGRAGSYYGEFVVSEENPTILIFSGKSSATSNYTYQCQIQFLTDGVVEVYGVAGNSNVAVSGYFYLNENNAGYVYAGLSWRNLVYKVTTYTGQTVYLLASRNTYTNANLKGIVSVESVNGIEFGAEGSIFRVTCPDGVFLDDGRSTTFTAKYNSNPRNAGNDGYVLSDAYVGTYTSQEEEVDDIVLDGFGNATIGPDAGTYTVSGNILVITIEGFGTYTCSIDTVNKTYVSVVADALIGKTFAATYSISGSGWGTYDATTTFAFDGSGGVTITSRCSEWSYPYDEDEPYNSACSFYNTTGTYTIDGTTVTVVFGSFTVTFTLDDADAPTQMTCASTTMTSSTTGYFATGRVFR